MDEKASIITEDRLKQFNEIYGYDDGNAIHNGEGEENEADFNRDNEEQSNPNEGEERKDEVHSLKSKVIS